MEKTIFIFLGLFILSTFSFPQRAFGLVMNVYVSIDSLTVPYRGVNVDPTIVTQSSDLQMSLYTAGSYGCGQAPRMVVIKNGVTSSGSSYDVSGGIVGSGDYHAQKIVNGTSVSYKSGYNSSSPVIANSDYNVDYTKEANFGFNYVSGDGSTYDLYLEVCGVCSQTANQYCNADCSAVPAISGSQTNCAVQLYVRNNTPTWTPANCAVKNCTYGSSSHIFLGKASNTNSQNYFYIFLQKLI